MRELLQVCSNGMKDSSCLFFFHNWRATIQKKIQITRREKNTALITSVGYMRRGSKYVYVCFLVADDGRVVAQSGFRGHEITYTIYTAHRHIGTYANESISAKNNSHAGMHADEHRALHLIVLERRCASAAHFFFSFFFFFLLPNPRNYFRSILFQCILFLYALSHQIEYMYKEHHCLLTIMM